MNERRLEKLIPNDFYDTHIHAPFPTAKPEEDVSMWKTGAMLSGYFFEKGMHLNSLKTIYPFKEKNLRAFIIPIPYGPFNAIKINESLIKNEGKLKNCHLILLGKIYPEKYSQLEKQIKKSKKIIGLKIYQNYYYKYTKPFLKNILTKEILKIADKYSLTFFIHANNPTHNSLNFINTILKKYKNIKIVLTHAALKLNSYNSFDYPNMKKYQKSLLNKKNIERNRKLIKYFEKRAKHIAEIPRLYVNTALISNEIMLYPIFKVLGPHKRIIYGSDLPFAYSSRIVTKRYSYNKTSKNIIKFFNGEKPSKVSAKLHYINLLFFLERILNVQNYIDSSKTQKVFNEILKETPQKLLP
jgi:hypothetical protein